MALTTRLTNTLVQIGRHHDLIAMRAKMNHDISLYDPPALTAVQNIQVCPLS